MPSKGRGTVMRYQGYKSLVTQCAMDQGLLDKAE